MEVDTNRDAKGKTMRFLRVLLVIFTVFMGIVWYLSINPPPFSPAIDPMIPGIITFVGIVLIGLLTMGINKLDERGIKNALRSIEKRQSSPEYIEEQERLEAQRIKREKIEREEELKREEERKHYKLRDLKKVKDKHKAYTESYGMLPIGPYFDSNKIVCREVVDGDPAVICVESDGYLYVAFEKTPFPNRKPVHTYHRF